MRRKRWTISCPNPDCDWTYTLAHSREWYMRDLMRLAGEQKQIQLACHYCFEIITAKLIEGKFVML